MGISGKKIEISNSDSVVEERYLNKKKIGGVEKSE